MRELIDAAMNGHLDLVKQYVAAGADINWVDEYGNTSLMVASYNGQFFIVKFLLESNAKIDMLTTVSQSIFEPTFHY